MKRNSVLPVITLTLVAVLVLSGFTALAAQMAAGANLSLLANSQSAKSGEAGLQDENLIDLELATDTQVPSEGATTVAPDADAPSEVQDEGQPGEAVSSDSGDTDQDTTEAAKPTSAPTTRTTRTTRSTTDETTKPDVIASPSVTEPGSTPAPGGIEYISQSKAIALALRAVGEAKVIKVEFENDRPPYYKVVLASSSTIYEVKVHAQTGAILEVDKESYEAPDSTEVDD